MSVEVSLQLDRGDFRLEAEFSAPGRGVTALFGPSGSGKTTLLRALAGLERDGRGRISINGAVWQGPGESLPPHRRAVGYVFQEASLFPHLSVRKNLDYGHNRRRANGTRGPNREEVIALLGIAPFLERDPQTLSGGERQRVALARALLSRPQLLLMDEPLAALDMASKAEILPYLERLHDSLSIPVLYVSHAADEVARLADHMLILDRGRICARGPASEVLGALDTPLARRDDAFAILEGVVTDPCGPHRLTTVDLGRDSLRLPCPGVEQGQRLRLRVYARDVSLCLDPPRRTSILNVLPAVIQEISPGRESGQETGCEDGRRLVRLMIDRQPLLARLSDYSCAALDLRPGLPVYAQIKALALIR